ncbi:MAG: protein tyrosine phosphatase-like domain-containing protein [Chitinophagales bacterium]
MLKIYLQFYNFSLSLLWAIVLVLFVADSGKLDFVSLTLLNIAQGAALLEILHAALKWVKSPVFTTAIQVSSRIFILILINIFHGGPWPEFMGISGLQLAVFAWSLTEIIRYAYYLTLLRNTSIAVLTWCRYTFFIFLYPIGVTGELMILYAWATQHGIAVDQWQVWFMAVVAVLYILFFPKMYLYMWKQRKEKILN